MRHIYLLKWVKCEKASSNLNNEYFTEKIIEKSDLRLWTLRGKFSLNI